jgi:hypothetical protein
LAHSLHWIRPLARRTEASQHLFRQSVARVQVEALAKLAHIQRVHAVVFNARCD